MEGISRQPRELTNWAVCSRIFEEVKGVKEVKERCRREALKRS